MNIQRKKDIMRFLTFLLTFLLALTACAAPAENLPATLSPVERIQAPPSLETEPTIAPVKPTADSAVAGTTATFESSLLAVEWKGGSRGNLLYPLDPVTGIALPGYTPISLGQSYFHAFSSDRRTLAAVVFPDDNAYNGSLLLIDLPAWKTRQFDLKLSGWVSVMAFSPDGGRLAIAHGNSTNRLTIFNLKQGVITAQAKEDSLITRMKFTADSETLMLYRMVIQNRFTENEMSGGASQVQLLNAADLSPRWSAELEGVRDGVYQKDEKATPTGIEADFQTLYYLGLGLAFAPDRDALYIVHADAEQLTTVDFSAQKVETVEIQDQLSWFERLLSLTAGVAHAKVANGTSKQAVTSPDGQLLYVVGMHHESSQDQQGNWQVSQTPLGLEIIQTGDGGRVERYETDAADLSLSPDGLFLYLRSWTESGPWTEIFDTSTRQITTHKAEIYASPALRMSGESLLVSTYSSSEISHHMSVLQPDGLKVLTEWTGPGYIAWLTP